MIVFPAIDVLGGKVVRLRQGRYDDVTQYGDDPVGQARMFLEAGAEWIHLVDLDGARTGSAGTLEIVRRIALLGMKVEAGGGIRTMEAIDQFFEAGACRVVLGTALVKDPALAVAACGRYDGIVAGIDARDGMVAIEGWRESTAVPVIELVRALEPLGLAAVALTDIARDGMQTGVNTRAYQVLAEQTKVPIVASGGVSTLDDIRALAAVKPKLQGVIVGRALYEGAFSLTAALAAAKAADAPAHNCGSGVLRCS